jgi:hypothetical protein
MLSEKPVAQLGNGRLWFGRHLGRDRVMQMNQQSRNRWLLRSRRDGAGADLALARFDNVGDANTEARRNLPGAPLCRQHAITQILRISLSTAPGHRDLRRLPETCESQVRGVPEPRFVILPSTAPL